MLKRERGLRKEEIEEIIKRGRSMHSPFMSIRYFIDSNKNSRFSFVISSKVSKSAVSRNLFKRRCRAIIKKHLNKIKYGGSFIFFAKNGVSERSYKELELDVIGLLERSKMLYSL